jgi:hypothetical protein
MIFLLPAMARDRIELPTRRFSSSTHRANARILFPEEIRIDFADLFALEGDVCWGGCYIQSLQQLG